jgi:hypothetical protein
MQSCNDSFQYGGFVGLGHKRPRGVIARLRKDIMLIMGRLDGFSHAVVLERRLKVCDAMADVLISILYDARVQDQECHRFNCFMTCAVLCYFCH